MSISKIVVTGGPCGGKTTALSRIQRDLSHLGYTVLIVPETATALIAGGVAPWTCGTNEEYQKCQMELQLQKERIFERAAATMARDKILIVCDRGELDNKVYMTDEEFGHVLEHLGVGGDRAARWLRCRVPSGERREGRGGVLQPREQRVALRDRRAGCRHG